jgi:hypothetical protein
MGFVVKIDLLQTYSLLGFLPKNQKSANYRYIVSDLSIVPQQTDRRLSFFDSIGNRISN